jgi:hypothetical protein
MNEKLCKHDYSGQLSCLNREVSDDPMSRDFCIPGYQYCEYEKCRLHGKYPILIPTYQVWIRLGTIFSRRCTSCANSSSCPEALLGRNAITCFNYHPEIPEIKFDDEFIEYATTRNAGDEIHIECRTSEGHKNALVTVDSDCSMLADFICKQINEHRPKL